VFGRTFVVEVECKEGGTQGVETLPVDILCVTHHPCLKPYSGSEVAAHLKYNNTHTHTHNFAFKNIKMINAKW